MSELYGDNALVLVILQLALRIITVGEELGETHSRGLRLLNLLLLGLLLFLLLLTLTCTPRT